MKPIDPQQALEAMWKLAPQYAQAKAHRIYLEEYRKTIKAQLMKACGLESIGAQEREAYADETYEAHLEALKEAVVDEETLRWRLIVSQAAVDVWRSQESTNRMVDRSAT